MTILKNWLFVMGVINQDTSKRIVWFWRFKDYDLNLQTKCFAKDSIWFTWDSSKKKTDIPPNEALDNDEIEDV